MIKRLRECLAGGGVLDWVPLAYLVLVPSLMFLTNIGERVYQDVFFVGLLIWAALRRQADWSPGVVSIWVAWVGYALWATLTDYLGSGVLTPDWFRGAALLMLLPWLVAWVSRDEVRAAISIGLRLALVVATVTALVQVYLLDVPRAHGSENANIFALLMALYGVFVIHESLRRGSKWVPLWVFMALVPLGLSGSRTALASFFVVLLVLIFIHRRQLPLKLISAGLAGVAVLIGVIAGPKLIERSGTLFAHLSADNEGVSALAEKVATMDFVERTSSEGEDKLVLKREFRSSLGYRLVYWRTGWEVAKAHPWVGVGSAGDMKTLGDRLGIGDWLAQRHSHVHNTFLQHLVTGGVPKLSLLLIALALPILLLRRRGERDRAWLIVAVTLAASLAGLTAVVFELHQFIFIYTLVLAYALTASIHRGTAGATGVAATRCDRRPHRQQDNSWD